MKEQEKEILQLTGELWNKFIQLPIMHPDDQNEFRSNLHAIQNMVYAREGIRSVEKEQEVSWSGEMTWFPPNIKYQEWGADKS